MTIARRLHSANAEIRQKRSTPCAFRHRAVAGIRGALLISRAYYEDARATIAFDDWRGDDDRY